MSFGPPLCCGPRKDYRSAKLRMFWRPTEQTARWRVFKARQKLLSVLAPQVFGPGKAMSCQKFQRRLFALPDPDRVPAVVRNHLAECSACREIHRRIAQVEHHAPLLVVPSSPYAKAALLRKIQSGPTRSRPHHPLRRPHSETFRHPGRRQLAGASLAAAALLLIVLGIRMVPGTNDTPPVAQVENKQPAPRLAGQVTAN